MIATGSSTSSGLEKTRLRPVLAKQSESKAPLLALRLADMLSRFRGSLLHAVRGTQVSRERQRVREAAVALRAPEPLDASGADLAPALSGETTYMR